MALPDLLLGTRRLRREIDAQSQQLSLDIEHTKHATAQLRRVAVARFTSPLGLLSALGAGFITGKVAGHTSHAKRSAQHAVGSLAALTLSAVRSIGMQVVLPLAIEWLQSKFTSAQAQATAADASTAADNQASAEKS